MLELLKASIGLSSCSMFMDDSDEDIEWSKKYLLQASEDLGAIYQKIKAFQADTRQQIHN